MSTRVMLQELAGSHLNPSHRMAAIQNQQESSSPVPQRTKDSQPGR